MSAPTEESASPMTSLSTFVFSRVLSEDSWSKKVACLGRFEGRDGDAILIVTRSHLPVDKMGKVLGANCQLQLSFQNDIYSKYQARLGGEHDLVNVDVVFPATAKHIAKHSAHEMFVVRETPEVYRAATEPYIQSVPEKQVSWVHNILDGNAEADRVLLNDPNPDTGFVLLPDLKWDQAQVQQLYCVAICRRRDLRSIRDLRCEHLPLLRNLRDAGCAAIRDHFGVAPEKLLLYLHYQPSYYHLHVHFTHVAAAAGGFGMAAGKAHLLDDVIGNLAEFGNDFYQRKALTFVLQDNHPLRDYLLKQKAAQMEGLSEQPR